MKKIIALFLLLIFICPVKGYGFGVSAEYACVIDAITGRVLYEKNANTQYSMASTTKIMTAILALEMANPSDVATVSQKASYTEGSSLYLKQGEKITVENLVYGLMLNSGNDAAVVIAEHLAENEEAFAKLMTEKAISLGLKNTSFKNPNGLDAEGHFTTAYELALIARYAMENDTFRKIVSTKTYACETVGGRKLYFSNHNKLLKLYNGCEGVKTGFTKKTGRCLVSSVNKNGFRLICVTLNAPDDWNDHMNLYNKLYNEYEMKNIIGENQFVQSINVEDGESDTVKAVTKSAFYLPLSAEEEFVFDTDVFIDKTVTAPINKGQKIGELNIIYEGKKLGSIDIISDRDIAKKESIYKIFIDNFKNMLRKTLS